ncbi:hypothetical protein SAMN05421739_102554 [Pontibacter chinhatensis]|uniref:Uncharacterized protein n=1 Tax=Pontibacter chinhatensis TaxID=1436961 RepID=A0A1I2RX97_9BACT|nr:hypothetical protein SAMN05421739_102554 [Pontibacter chinhatensis]
MKFVKVCEGSENKVSLPILGAVAFILFMYFAGEAVGQFLYFATH